jgi:hypothetical protein
MTVLHTPTDRSLPSHQVGGGRLYSALRVVGIVLLSGMLGGVVWGIGARGAMRVIALAAEHYPEFSWGGTLMILMLGACMGILISLPYLAVRRLFRRGWLQRGLLYGLLVLLALGYLVYLSPPFQGEVAETGELGLAIALFAPLLVIYGIVVAAVYEFLDQRILRTTQRHIVAALSIGLLILPVIYEAGIGVLLYLTSTGKIRL